MSEFSCSVCDYTSFYKSNISNHINKKNKCGDNPKIIKTTKKISCDYCNKNYKTKVTLSNHLKICKLKNTLKDLYISKKDDEIAKLKEELKHSKRNQTVNVNIGTVVNIQLNSYRNTDMSKISDTHFSRALNRTLMSIPQLIEYTHFNPKLPENHNIYISNKKNKHAMVYNGKEWELKNQVETIDRLIFDQEYAMEEWVNGVGDKNPKAMEKFQKYLDVREKDGAIESMKDEIRLLLYNKRNTIDK